MKYLTLLLLTGCTINLQIDTDYASQNGGGGSIEEEVTTESSASNAPTVDANVDTAGL
ncbi:hypothetical protein [Vibrio phage vB_VpaS_CHI]|nr:hypothetical protein [Vibrio phage vB_VpaS_ALK]USL90132.1 hypothetical protein [Vibrio phage vB_VpaS_CHI]